MIGAHLVERALGQHLAFGHHDHRIAELGDEAHVVLDQQHGDAAARQLEQPLADLVLQGRIDAGGRLVEQHEPWFGHQRAADFQKLLLAARQRGGGIVDQVIEPEEARRRPRPLGQLGFALARRPRAQNRLPQGLARLVAAIEHEVLEHRQPGKAARHLEGAHQPAPAHGIGRQPRDLPTVETNRACVRRHQAGDHVEQRRLARPVGPDQPGDAARRHGKIDARSTSRP